jgi:hypothetical protein
MAWKIECSDNECKKMTKVSNIVELIKKHRDSEGWFLCSCGHNGFIYKPFKLQEKGKTWEPYLRGIIPLGDEESSYQPFFFLVSYKSTGVCNSVWISYYKDLRKEKGKLKLGYGPGGPPVLKVDTIKEMLKQLKKLQLITKEDIIELIE